MNESEAKTKYIFERVFHHICKQRLHPNAYKALAEETKDIIQTADDVETLLHDGENAFDSFIDSLEI